MSGQKLTRLKEHSRTVWLGTVYGEWEDIPKGAKRFRAKSEVFSPGQFNAQTTLQFEIIEQVKKK